MDVRCERCKTEYEFEDERVTEAGVAVKCTQCGHVFKVKKKAFVVSVPMKPGEDPAAVPLSAGPAAEAPAGLAAAPMADGPVAPPVPAPTAPSQSPAPTPTASPPSAAAPTPSAPPAERLREWRIRQANGNLFSLKDLTTLQKWIVERKVSRDDEISYDGDTWKRLGNIPDLATFFQVVDEAQKAYKLEALVTSQPPVELTHRTAPSQPAAAAMAPTGASAANSAPVRASGARPVMNARAASAARPVSGGLGLAGWMALFLSLLVISVTAFVAYLVAWVPKHPDPFGKRVVARLQRTLPAAGPLLNLGSPTPVAPAPPAQTTPKLVTAPVPVAPAPTVQPDAGAALASASSPSLTPAGFHPAQVLDAGTSAVPREARSSPEAPGARPEASSAPSSAHGFAYYMAEGDRLRDRERPMAALEAYAHAEQLEPDRAEPVAGKALALFDMGKKTAAVSAFQRALELDPSYGVAIMGLAEAYRAMGQNEDAIKEYERYLQVMPDGREAPVAKTAIEQLKQE